MGDFFAGVGGRHVSRPGAAVSISWVASCTGASVAGLYVLVFGVEGFTKADMRWTVLAMVLVALVRPLIYLGMERGPMSVFSPVVAVVSLVVPAVVGPLTGDSLSVSNTVGVILAVPAVLLIVGGGRLPTWAAMRSGPALSLGCAAGGLLSCLRLTFAQISPDAGAMPAFLTQLGSVVLIPLLVRAVQPMAELDREVSRFGLLVGLIDIGAIISSVIAFQHGNVAVVASVLSFGPVSTIGLAWRVYGESVRRWQWAGAGLAAASVVLFTSAS